MFKNLATIVEVFGDRVLSLVGHTYIHTYTVADPGGGGGAGGALPHPPSKKIRTYFCTIL